VDFLFAAQGEDVVSGRHRVAGVAGLADVLPGVHAELVEAKARLEAGFRDMQDFEFTVQDGRLYFLQTRAGKRTAWAALQIAVDMVAAGLVTPREALEQLRPFDLRALSVRLMSIPPRRLATAVGGLAWLSRRGLRRERLRVTRGQRARDPRATGTSPPTTWWDRGVGGRADHGWRAYRTPGGGAHWAACARWAAPISA
jgi:hypothetical protein